MTDGGQFMPGDRGTELGLDLWELYRAGSQSLPAVAREFYTASRHVRTAGEWVEQAFTRPSMFGGTFGPARTDWMDLMGMIKKFLEDTADNLDATGEALVLAAQTYAETDRAAGRELIRLIREHDTE
jgi:hypothetical protein